MDFQTIVGEIAAQDLKKRLDAGEEITVLDVRESHELAICSLKNTIHVPLGQLTVRLAELEPLKEQNIVVYCRSGKRSERAAQYMIENGYKKVLNLQGGILAWADEVDPSMTKY